VEDIQLVKQQCTAVSVKFDDTAVADFYDQQVDQGRKPEQFGRIWIHTHPGDCPLPSLTDEATFERCFGSTDWAVMFIIAAGGATYARMQFNVGPGGAHRIRTEVDFHCEFGGADTAASDEEYDDHVLAMDPFCGGITNRVTAYFDDVDSDADDTPAHMSEVIDEWYLRAEAVDLIPDVAEEEAWNQYLAAAD